MARAKQPVSVDDIEFDALIDSEEGYEADVPEYPTEKGFSVSDTIVLKADTLNMTLYVTDTPVTWRERTGSGPGKTEGVVRRLKDLYFAKKILEVTTTDCVYSNMVITSMNIKKSVEVGYAREIPIAFKKIEVTETATAEIPASYGKSGKTAKAAGKASTTAASTAGSGSSGGSSASGSSSSSSRGSVLYNAASSFGLLGKEGVRGLLRHRSPGHERQRCQSFPPKQAVSTAIHME